MADNVWTKLAKPIMALAPMADVTDAAFRQIINKYGKPDLFYTEFVSADGLCHDAAQSKLLRDLSFTTAEKPIIGQIFGARPENIESAARLIAELGFDGVDINMGCPDRGVERQGAGAALIKNPDLAKEIILAAKAGAGGLPVSVKTRIGYRGAKELEAWAAALLKTKPAAITFHLRTRQEMSRVPAHWDLIRLPVAMAKGTGTLILGNGDVNDLTAARNKVVEYGVDGVMFGRGIFGNPWLFSRREKSPELVEGLTVSIPERLRVMVEHTKLFWKLFGPTETKRELFGGHGKNFAIMKKHFKAYVTGFDGAAALREKLMAAENPDEVERSINRFLQDKK